MKFLTLFAVVAALLLSMHQVQAKYLPTDKWTPGPEDAEVEYHPKYDEDQVSSNETSFNATASNATSFTERSDPASNTTTLCKVHLMQEFDLTKQYAFSAKVLNGNDALLGFGGTDYFQQATMFTIENESLPKGLEINFDAENWRIQFAYGYDIWYQNNHERCEAKYKKVYDVLLAKTEYICTFECP